MKQTRLVLIRHAKTEQQGPPNQGDHGRRLLTRGEADGAAAGRWLAEEGLIPDLVLCSTAVRAVQTWAAMVDGCADLGAAEVCSEPRIYHASPEALLDVVTQAPEGVAVVAIVGHAPGIPALAAELADPEQSNADAVERFNDGYPTMTLAVLEGQGAHSDLEPGSFASSSMVLTAVHTARGDH